MVHSNSVRVHRSWSSRSFIIVIISILSIFVLGQVESALKEHLSDCGEITRVFVNALDKQTNIYFSLQQEEARALYLHGTKVGGFKLDISRVASVLSNRPFDNGEIGLGYTVLAHMIEFANKKDDEIEDKVIVFKKQRRSN
ncbi:nucleolin 1-like [Raphanus sativus]|nr:nucleolin 1-like [Raphanus sativus]